MAQGRASGVSFFKQLNKVKEGLDQILPLFLTKLSGEVVRLSPVFSGDYVKQHTIVVGNRSAAGQFTRAFTKSPESSNPAAEKAEALGNLTSQIMSLSKDTTSVSLSNTVPHAFKVEYAGWGSKAPYMVYQTARAKAPQFLQEAKVELGLR